MDLVMLSPSPVPATLRLDVAVGLRKLLENPAAGSSSGMPGPSSFTETCGPDRQRLGPCRHLSPSPSGWRELRGIRQQVNQRLIETIRIETDQNPTLHPAPQQTAR